MYQHFTNTDLRLEQKHLCDLKASAFMPHTTQYRMRGVAILLAVRVVTVAAFYHKFSIFRMWTYFFLSQL